MAEKRDFSGGSALENFRSHSLDNFCPPLRKYLSDGLTVLDIGCGPGSVTVNVAEAIGTGTIIGMDREEKSLGMARELAGQLGLDNIRITKGDANDLPFDAGTFDLAFSSAVYEYLVDPVFALREAARVVKPGGRVIVRAGDFGTLTLYPDSPALMKILSAWMEDTRKSEDRYFNGCLGREIFDVFRKAGLDDIYVEAFVPPLSCNYPGSEYFEWRRMMNENWFDPERRRSSPYYADGTIDDQIIEQARKEIDTWCEHPGAFFMITSVLAAGSVR